MHMNKLCFVKKIFFMKEILFSFAKYFLVLGKLLFFLISKNLTASAFADCQGEFQMLTPPPPLPFYLRKS